MTKFHLPVVSLSPVFFFLTSSCVRFRHLNLKSCFAVLPAVGRKRLNSSWWNISKVEYVAGTWLDMTPWTVCNNWLTGSTLIDQWCFWSEARNKVAKEREKDCQQSKLPLLGFWIFQEAFYTLTQLSFCFAFSSMRWLTINGGFWRKNKRVYTCSLL